MPEEAEGPLEARLYLYQVGLAVEAVDMELAVVKTQLITEAVEAPVAVRRAMGWAATATKA
jgi:hypothetical protein